MTNKPTRQNDNMYHVHGKRYPTLIGSRAQVWHGTAYKTRGELVKKDLIMNKHGRIVSALKHRTAKKEKRLAKAGYLTRKGKFGFVKKGGKRSLRRMKGGADVAAPAPAAAADVKVATEPVPHDEMGGKGAPLLPANV